MQSTEFSAWCKELPIIIIIIIFKSSFMELIILLLVFLMKTWPPWGQGYLSVLFTVDLIWSDMQNSVLLVNKYINKNVCYVNYCLAY